MPMCFNGVEPTQFCCTCGRPRGISPVRDSLRIYGSVHVGDTRELLRPTGFNYEESPVLLVHVDVWRNGGTSPDQFICDGCLLLGVRRAYDKLARLLQAAGQLPAAQDSNDTPVQNTTKEVQCGSSNSAA